MVKILIFALMSLVSAQQYNQYLPPTTTSQTDLDVIEWTNIARTDPSRIVPILQNMIQYFTGNTYSYPGKTPILTNEGVTAVNEAITYMQSQAVLTQLKWDQYLGQAALGMAVDQGLVSGATGHTAPNGDTMSDRLAKCGTWGGSAGENIAYGTEGGQNIVLQLIIDDGVSGRGHRANIFNTGYTLMGSGTANNVDYGTETVIDYAGTYTGNGACSLAQTSLISTPGSVVATKTPTDSASFDVYSDNDGKFISFWTDILWTVLVKNTWYSGTIAIVEYYTSYWKAWMYVFGFPVFLVIFWVWKWRLNDITYNQTLYNMGIEWMQDNYINNFEKMVEYHYMQYCSQWNGIDDLSMFVKTVIMILVFFLDLGILLSGIITQTLGILINFYYVLVEIVIQTSDIEKQTFFSYFDLEAQTGILSATTYYYNLEQTWWNGGAGGAA